MKYLLLALLLGCSNSAKYKAGQCFMAGPFILIEVNEVTSEDYIITVHGLIPEKKRFKHSILESDVEKNGAIVESCSKFSESK